ncbi:hypothetical protein M758_6G118500 [Ceratodon purpureus]|nr:hypothetical protein M758_6G118500 [Ceratodon purpureus]
MLHILDRLHVRLLFATLFAQFEVTCRVYVSVLQRNPPPFPLCCFTGGGRDDRLAGRNI